MSEAQQITRAIETAERIKDAIVKKIPKYTGYVRRYDTGDNGFIEIAIKPEGMHGPAHEITTAYSDEYFLSATKENINEKAKRIFRDFKILLGAKE